MPSATDTADLKAGGNYLRDPEDTPKAVLIIFSRLA